MKRIIRAMALGLSVSVFFTGCSSTLSGSQKVDVSQVESSVAEAEDSSGGEEDGDGIHLNYSDEERNQDAPDYFEEYIENRFRDLEGKPAFKIADGHSKEVSSLEIGALLPDRTFVYGYSTGEEGGSEDTIIHCGAFYNYETEAFRIFHETRLSEAALGEDEDAFFMQVCQDADGNAGDIFIYDNGYGYLYSSAGALKFQVDIGSFVRKCYPDVWAVNVMQALTDGDNRIYLELSIEKEEISLAAGSGSGTDMSEEDLEQELEDLEREEQEKMAQVILVYDFQEVDSGLLQENLAFEEQKNAWISMTEGEEYTEEPDPEADWEAVREACPDLWGGAVLTDLEDLPVYQWKADEIFSYEGESGICTLFAEPLSYMPFTELAENSPLSGTFSALDGRYSRLFGNTGEITETDEETITRTYTLVTEQEVEKTDEEGNPVTETEKVLEEKTQEITVCKSRETALSNAYMERYWNVDRELADSLGNCVDGSILCSGDDGKVYWIRQGGTLEYTGITLAENNRVGAIVDQGTMYLVTSDSGSVHIITDEVLTIPYQDLAGGHTEGDSAYDQMFSDFNLNSMPEGIDVYGGGEYFTEETVLPVDLEVDRELAAALSSREPEGGWPEQGGTWNGFLFTSRSRGLTYYAPDQGEGIQLSQGIWYRSFKLGNRCVSLGFFSGDTSFEGLNVSYARVYEYDLDGLCREIMETALEESLEREEEERIQESLESSLAAEEDPDEKDPLDQWNEEYKDKYSLGK